MKLCVCACVCVSRPLLTYNGVDLLQQLQLHVWMLLEEQQHEEQTDGQSIRGCDHHLQHTLGHILTRQFTSGLHAHRVDQANLAIDKNSYLKS